MSDDEEYVEAVLACVELVPAGRVTTYGALADHLHGRLGRGGPRQVGAVLARHGGPVPWWRVVRADGSLPPSHDAAARRAYLAEGTPLRGPGRVDVRRAFWDPATTGGGPASSTGTPGSCGEGTAVVEEEPLSVDDTPVAEKSWK